MSDPYEFKQEHLGTWPDDTPHKQVYVPMCRHCKKEQAQHELNKCLFDSTSFTPMPEDEWVRWYVANTLIDVSGATTGRLSSNPPYISTSRPLTAQDIIQAHSLLTRKAWLKK